MGQFGMVITGAGLQLLQFIQAAGGTLAFTRMATGDGQLAAGQMPNAQTALVSEVQSVSISSCQVVDGQATVRGDISNDGLAAAYTICELGLFAADIQHPGNEILYAYGNAGSNGDYMPAGGAGDVVLIIQEIVVSIGGATSVSASIDNSAVYVTGAQWQAHVGVGGEAQHPDATTSTAGFMSAADKAVLDGISASYTRKIKAGNAADPTFFDSGAYDLGWLYTHAGEILLGAHPETFSWLFSMNVDVINAATVTIPVVTRDDNLYLYVDGQLIGSLTGATNSEQNLVWNATAGTHLVQLMLTGDSQGTQSLCVAAWMDLVNVVKHGA